MRNILHDLQFVLHNYSKTNIKTLSDNLSKISTIIEMKEFEIMLLCRYLL